VPRQWDKIILRLATLMAILVPLSVLIYIWLQRPPEPPPPLVDMERVQRILESFQCAQLTAALIETDRVAVKGRVASDDDLRRLTDAVRTVEGVAALTAEVEVLVWPFCEVVEILAPYKHINDEQQRGLRISPYQHSGSYVEGEKLILELSMPDQDAYVYADYYPVPEGERNQVVMAHLFPNPLAGNNLFRKRQSEIIGMPGVGKRHWDISPPFGKELLVVMVSSRPLFTQQRMEVENTEAYLADLRQALQGAGGLSGDVTADYLFIATAPKER
jgi:hypothetical protein